MPELSQSSPTPRNKIANLRAAAVAGQQWGVIGLGQLNDCGLGRTTTARWRSQGRLHLMYPGVFALGHRSIPIEGHLVAALLHAGEGVVLSHATAAWWWGLIDHPPAAIDLSSTRRMQSLPGLVIHQRRRLESTRHRRFPVTTLPQTFLDFAAVSALSEVRRALAEADFRGILHVEAVAGIAGRGKPGAARLRTALKCHEPRIAYTRSQLERAFLGLCETAGIPLPDVNVRIGRWTVDAVWRRERLVVELDGHDNHRTCAQIERDRQKELELRAAGFAVLRYTWAQVTEEPGRVIDDLLATLRGRG